MFEVFQSEKNNKFYFNLKAKNGQIILQVKDMQTKEVLGMVSSPVKKCT